MRAAKDLVAPDFRCSDEPGFTVAMSDSDPAGLDGFDQFKHYTFRDCKNDWGRLALGSANGGLIDLDDQSAPGQQGA